MSEPGCVEDVLETLEESSTDKTVLVFSLQGEFKVIKSRFPKILV